MLIIPIHGITFVIFVHLLDDLFSGHDFAFAKSSGHRREQTRRTIDKVSFGESYSMILQSFENSSKAYQTSLERFK